MSIKNVRNQITKFLQSEKAQVLCIRGHWGTGKTWTWDDVLKNTAPISLQHYSYVSLFGLNSLDDIKQEIFHQTKPVDTLGKPFSTDTMKDAYQSAWAKLKPATSGIVKFFGENYSTLSTSVMSYLIRDTIICIDDLERKGEHLRSADVLGLISQLKDDRNCKVVLLLNDEQLEDRDEFDTFLEKVVDVSLRFAPSPAESAETAFIGEVASPLVRQELTARAIKLRIDNVRVIRKILRTINELEPMLKAYKPEVMKSIISSMTLFGWSYLQRDSSPPFDYIRSIGEYSSDTENPDQAIQEMKQKWGQLLREYRYTLTDEFDEILMDGVVNGYFDPVVVALYAGQLHEREKAIEANVELDKAWDLFHGSFGDNVGDIIALVVDCFKRNAKVFNFSALAQFLDLFRRMEQVEASNDLFEAYVAAHGGNPGAFDLDRLERFGTELPGDIIARIKEIQQQAMPALNTDEMFLKLKEVGYRSEVGLEIAKLPVDEYVRVLTTHTNEELQRIRDGLTDFVDVSNPNSVSQEIMHKAAEALSILAEQSPLNKQRARSWRLIQWNDKFKAGAFKDA